MAKTIIANLPTTSEIKPDSYVIIERPGIGQGTYKSTVGDLQDAITVHATVEQENDVTTITVSDINGTTQETIVTPTAKIVDNGDNTCTIIITDTLGVTTDTVVSKVILDPYPLPDSPNMLTSGTIYSMRTLLEERIAAAEGRLDLVEDRESISENRLDAMDRRMDNIEAWITRLETRLEIVEVATDESLVIESNNVIDKPFRVNGESYREFLDALLAAAASNRVLRLSTNGTTKGISVPSGTDVTIDLGGHTLFVTGPGAGSPGTETNGMQLLKDSNITFRNGKIVFNDSRLRMGIQNYSNLMLDNIDISGGPSILYVVSNNYGNIVFANGTKITASEGRVAFDVWYGLLPVYYDGVNVRIADSSVEINGKVEYGKQRGAPGDKFSSNASLTYPQSMHLDLDILTKPCVFILNDDGTKTVRYLHLVTDNVNILTQYNEMIMTQDEFELLAPVKVADPPIVPWPPDPDA